MENLVLEADRSKTARQLRNVRDTSSTHWLLDFPHDPELA